MRKCLPELLLPIIGILIGFNAHAYDFVVDGIYYNKNEDGTSVSVTYKEYDDSGYSGDVIIPETVIHEEKTYSVTTIGVTAFSDCADLTSEEIPNSVTMIDGHAFYGCTGLTSVTIPNSVTSIGGYAFCGCTGLTSIEISSVTTIGEYAFYSCTGLTSIELPNSVTSIGGYAFYRCIRLTSIEIPSSVTSIGDNAFGSCYSLANVYITDIAKWCVIKFGRSSSNPLYNDAQLYLNKEKVTDLVIPEGVTLIGDYAFCFYSGLNSVTIGENVEKIGYSAFYNCKNLTEINSLNPIPPVIESSTFGGVDKNACVLNVPFDSKIEYELELYWKDFLNINEKDFGDLSGINNIVGIGEVVEVARYTIDGRMIDEPQRGVNIVRYSDGSVRKVLVK